MAAGRKTGGDAVVANAKKRMANMELLRILAMLMVVMLHYLDKGRVLPSLAGELSVNGYLAWGLELLAIVSVDVYMLISGFFLAGSSFKSRRLVELLCQALFYSLLIPLLLIAAGILDPAKITLYQLLYYILPTQMVHYWFLTAYVLMYLFSPLLGVAVRSMKKNQLRAVILLLLLFLSVNKSVLPVRLEMDNLGYDGIWFMCVFVIAAYLRLYGLEELEAAFGGKEKKLRAAGFLGYLALWAGMFGLTMGIRFLYRRTGQFESVLNVVCGYNHILTLLAAVCLFIGFYAWKLKEGAFSRLVVKAAPYTLGVYLLHEHCEVRYLWPEWLHASMEGNPLLFVLRCVGAVSLVLVIGILSDMARGAIFGLAARVFAGGRIDRWLGHVDDVIAGRGEQE